MEKLETEMRREYEQFTKELKQLQYHIEAQPTPPVPWIAGIYRGQAKEFDARNGGRAERSVLTIKMVKR